MPSLTIEHVTARPNHGGFHTQVTEIIDLDTGEAFEYLSRCFVCVCGEPLHDGDRVLSADNYFDPPVHVNCASGKDTPC